MAAAQGRNKKPEGRGNDSSHLFWRRNGHTIDWNELDFCHSCIWAQTLPGWCWKSFPRAAEHRATFSLPYRLWMFHVSTLSKVEEEGKGRERTLCADPEPRSQNVTCKSCNHHLLCSSDNSRGGTVPPAARCFLPLLQDETHLHGISWRKWSSLTCTAEIQEQNELAPRKYHQTFLRENTGGARLLSLGTALLCPSGTGTKRSGSGLESGTGESPDWVWTRIQNGGKPGLKPWSWNAGGKPRLGHDQDL